MHRGHLTAHTDKTTSGQILSGSIDQLLYVVRHISQVLTICPSINVDYRSDIIVILNRSRGTARNRGDIGHNLGLARITPKNRQVAQIIQGMQIILRRFGVDLIANPVARVDPEVWRNLGRAGKRTEHALGYCLRVDPLDRRQRTIDGDIELRDISRLLYAEIHRTWNVFDLFHQTAREFEISR